MNDQTVNATAMVQPRALEHMVGRATRWEVGIIDRDTGQLLQRLAFTQRRTKVNLFKIMKANADAIIAADPEADAAEWNMRHKRWDYGKVYVAATSRTERDCAMELARAVPK